MEAAFSQVKRLELTALRPMFAEENRKQILSAARNAVSQKLPAIQNADLELARIHHEWRLSDLDGQTNESFLWISGILRRIPRHRRAIVRRPTMRTVYGSLLIAQFSPSVSGSGGDRLALSPSEDGLADASGADARPMMLLDSNVLIYASDERSPLSDFFIGSHAEVMDWTLVTADEGRFRTYFPSVPLNLP